MTALHPRAIRLPAAALHGHYFCVRVWPTGRKDRVMRMNLLASAVFSSTGLVVRGAHEARE